MCASSAGWSGTSFRAAEVQRVSRRTVTPASGRSSSRRGPHHWAKGNRTSAIPSANAKVSTGVTFFPHLRMAAPTDDSTDPAMIGLINRLMHEILWDARDESGGVAK
jgi:hypothetical protein